MCEFNPPPLFGEIVSGFQKAVGGKLSQQTYVVYRLHKFGLNINLTQFTDSVNPLEEI